jgi:hypothetical protein
MGCRSDELGFDASSPQATRHPSGCLHQPMSLLIIPVVVAFLATVFALPSR